jgi:hypothetical protein
MSKRLMLADSETFSSGMGYSNAGWLQEATDSLVMNMESQGRENEEEYHRLLAALPPDKRLQLFEEDFNLQSQLLRKRQYRRALAKLSAGEKLRLLEELRKRSQMQRGLRKAPAANPPPTVEEQAQGKQAPNPVILQKLRLPRFKMSPQRFGGRSTAGGVSYEVRIAAFIATKMLAGDRCTAWNGISGADVAAITLQAPEQVDDIVVSLRGESEARVFISAKDRAKTIPLTAKSPAFADTISAFVGQFLKLPPGARERNRLVWAVPPSAGTSATRDLPFGLDSHREDACATLSDFLRGRQVRERKAIDALIAEAKRVWKRKTGKSPSNEELREFLRLVHVEVYEFEFGQKDDKKAEDDIRSHIVADPQWAKRVWRKLESIFNRADQRGMSVTAPLLRRELIADGLILKSPPDYADDIALLNALTARNLSRLKDHTMLRFGAKQADEIHIPRTEELSALVAAVKAGGLLVTGEPGCGKSGLIHQLAEALRKDGLPVVLLLAEEILGRDWKSAANIPGLSHALDEVLANWPSGERGFLITDALDAVREVDTQKMLRRLLQDVKQGQSGWTVVASVREFDLKHSRELREAFPGDGVGDYACREFSGVSHFHVIGLAESKLDDLCALRPDIRPFIGSARDNVKSGGVHRSPFFLRLAADLLRDGVTPVRLADWNSPAVLLRKFWEARVQDGAGASEREVALQAICRRMTELRSMALSIKEVSIGAAGRDAVIELRSRGILQAPAIKHGTRVGAEDIRFSHHLLHDYAVARSLIPATSTRFADFAVAEPLLAVFYRQSFMFALEELWDEGDDRRGFWESALKLESVAQLHGITRILAPILAAKRVDTLADLQPLLTAIGAANDSDAPAQKALQHLASGLQDADPDTIRAGASAWCAFVEKLSNILPRLAFLEFPLVHIVARLNAIGAAIDASHQLALNKAARALLTHHVSKEVSKGWRYAALTAIEVLCKTFDIAPAESEHALLSLLTQERLAHFPHWDLFDLAHQIKYLGANGDLVVLKLFETAFETEPKNGEWEEFGSRIMPMRIQSSDNWNSIHHSLAEYYEACAGSNARLMTDIACIAWNAVVRRRAGRRDSGEKVIAAISFRGITCHLVEDYGHIWGREFEHEESRILSRFETLLREWAAANDTERLRNALDRFASRNRTSMMWTVFMEAGAEYPSTLGILLEDVLNESLFLTHPDYSYGGTALLGALHKMGGSARRERLERLILELPKAARFLRDAPRDPMPSWLENAQNRLLGALEDSNIVLQAVRELRKSRSGVNKLPTNKRPKRPQVTSHTFSDEELIERRGISLKEPANAELSRLREALKPFIERDGKKVNVAEVEQHWRIIAQCESALTRHRSQHPKMAQELWGHLVGACESIARHADWPADSHRWTTVRRILLKAAKDPDPKPSDDEDSKEDRWPSWGWPAPRLDAARGLPFLAYHLGKADKSIAKALRKLCRDKSHPLRFNLAERLAVLERVAPAFMWQLIDIFIAHEKKFSVLDALLLSLDRLWGSASEEVKKRLFLIFERAMRCAPADNGIHETLAYINLFRFLRTGDTECEAFITNLIEECDSQRASHALAAQLHNCRQGGWLTVGDGVSPDVRADAVRKRTWTFFSRVLSAAQEKLKQHREHWQRLHKDGQPDADTATPVQQAIERSARLVDGIGMQIFFASGAHDARQNKTEKRLSEVQLKRFWNEATALFGALSTEPHPRTAYHLVQTLHHLLPCAPREVFLIATKSICNSASAGFQYESLAVAEVVKIIQRALADHRDIFKNTDQKEYDCLEWLLKTLDLFVEAGWAEARQLTHRLEEIYR